MDEVKTTKQTRDEVLKDAITAFVSFKVADVHNAEEKSKFLDNFKLILKSEDTGVTSWLEKILPVMKQEADALGITTNPKEEFSTEEPEAEEPAEATEEETPEEEATEEEPTPEATEEATPAEEVKTEGQKMTRGEFLVEVANNYID